MARFGPAAIVSLIVILLGVIFFVGAVGGMLFAGATPIFDVGLWSVFIVAIVLGGVGLWVSLIDNQAQRP